MDQALLQRQQFQRSLIAPHGGELGKSCQVSENDRTLLRAHGRCRARCRAHSAFTSSEPDILLASISKSFPWAVSHRALPLSDFRRTCGCRPLLTPTLIKPDTVRSSTSSRPSVSTSIDPLIVEALIDPPTLPALMLPLFVFRRQLPLHLPTNMEPLTARTSTSPVAESIAMEPEIADILTKPNSPLICTPPDIEPTDTFVPSGQ